MTKLDINKMIAKLTSDLIQLRQEFEEFKVDLQKIKSDLYTEEKIYQMTQALLRSPK